LSDPTGLRGLLFGDAPIDAWPPAGPGPSDGEPWVSFVEARGALERGDRDAAIARWRAIAAQTDLESRHVAQAWHFLRIHAVQPEGGESTRVLGAVAEVALGEGHDVLAAYADGTVRYLNVGGGASVIDTEVPSVAAAVGPWLEAAEVIVAAIGPWTEPERPPLPAGHTRVTVLTPSGPFLGQGPDEALRADPMAAAFLAAATAVLVAVVDLTTPADPTQP
jgi:hypothetical protein